MRHVFDNLGYRRYEWKRHMLNVPSRAAAERLGFTYEGTFRQAAVVRGRSRDTTWYAAWTPSGLGCAPASRPGSHKPTGPTAPPGPPRRPLADCRADARFS